MANAQTIRAVRGLLEPVARHRSLLASPTRTNIGGLRINIPPSQVPGRAAAWTCRWMMTLFAPMISSRRKDRSPILVVAQGAACLPWNAASV